MLDLIGRYGYEAVFFGVMAESAGVPLPGETILLVSGALAHRGVLNLVYVLIFGILGAVVGDQLGYWTGRLGGRAFVLRWGRYVLVTPGRLELAEAFFARHGGRAVFLARVVAGLRVFGALAVGTSRMPWGRFAVYNVLGGALWATAVVCAGYLLWASVSAVEHWIGRASLIVVSILTLVLLARLVYRKVSRGGPKGGPPNATDRSS